MPDDATPAEPRKPRVFALSPMHSEGLKLAKQHFDLVLPDEPGAERWREEAEGLLARTTSITAADVEILARNKCKYVAKQGVGVDAIDSAAMKKHGIILMNTPGINAVAVAELTIGLMLDVARLISNSDRRIKAGENVTKTDGWTGQTIRGKTLGIIGGGNIGSRVGQMFSAAFAGDILLYDPYLTPEWEAWWAKNIPADKFRRLHSLDELLALSDIVSPHCPLYAETRDMIKLRELKLMKDTAILVNAARGGIINEDDLAVALDDGVIFGAGVDAFVEEPPTLKRYERLCKNPRMVLLPHYGAAISQVQQDTNRAMVEHLVEALQGKPCRDRLT